MQKRIRFINTYEPVSRHYRDLIPILIEKGYEVEVLISRAQYRASRDQDWIRPEIKITWVPCFGLKPQGIIGKASIMLIYMVWGAFYTLFGPRVEKNIFLTQPPLFAFWGYVLRRLRKQSHIQIVMDIYPDLAIAMGVLKKRSPLTRLSQKISYFTLRHADNLIVIGRCMREKLIDIGVNPERITIIPNWSNAQAIQSLSHSDNPFRTQNGWKDKFVVVFAGNVGIPQYFDDMLEVCYHFRNHSDFIFAVIGDGYQKAKIEEYKTEHQLENIMLLPFQSPSEQTYFLSAGDLHFISLRAGIEGLAVPSKTYSIMAAGRPIIYQGNPKGEIAQLVKEENIGVVIEPGNPDALQSAILRYLENPALGLQQGERAHSLSENSYGYGTICNRYLATLNAVANSNNKRERN